MAHILPQVGELWLDTRGEHNLVLDGYESDGELFFELLTLDTGEIYSLESAICWNGSVAEGTKPFYYKRIG